MTNSLNVEISVFFSCVILGLTIGIIFDFFKALRYGAVVKHFIVIIQDVIFCTIAAFVAFVTILNANGAQLRLYMPLGTIIGFIFYRLLFSKYVLLLLVAIKKMVIHILKFVIKILTIPFLKITEILLKPFLALKRKVLRKKVKFALTFNKFCFKIKCKVLKLFSGRKICKERKLCRKKLKPGKRV